VNSTLPTRENFYRFDDVTVDCENFRVLKNGQDITLTPRAFDVLIFLLHNGGRVVEKKEIFDFVWKDTFVSDNALTKIIKEIRRAFDDDANKPRYIETVPKRGYRFIGEVKEKSNQTASEIETTRVGQIVVEEKGKPSGKTSGLTRQTIPPRFVFSKTALTLSAIGLLSILALAAWLLFGDKPVETPLSPIRSIAVLPFKPLNVDSRDESLEMGMAETLTTRLSNLKQIVVRPISAVRKYTDLQQDPVKAGQEIQVEAVLDGSIQKAGERVRVTVRLLDVRNGTSLWAEQFDEDFTDIFEVQDSIAERITNALTLQLSRQEKEQLAKHYTDNPEAYQLYLQGQYLWHRRPDNWLRKSLSYYQQALEKDPNFALAHVWSAECYITLSQNKSLAPEVVPKAKDSVMKALALDDNLAEAHNALAEIKYQFEYDWAGAEKSFQRAIELNPNVVAIHTGYGWFLMTAGRFDEARTEMEKAQELDPNSIFIRRVRAQLLYFARQYDQAFEDFQKIIAVEPKFSLAYLHLAFVYEQKQMYAESVEAWLKSQSLEDAPLEKIDELREIFRTSGWQGFIRKLLENAEARDKIKPVSPLTFAGIYVRLGQKNMAFACLDKAFDERDPSIVQLKIEPAYDSLREDSRYTELIRKIGLQP
jgi:DNA-binding winged helix-turn-helix (wHTH) protein/TolB-like protein/cytochrome c-type biogenesis protein CcmH/NrfG